MTVPNKPYAVSAQVALLLPNLMNSKTDFDDNTTIKKSAVDQYLTWISNEIDLQFQQAGYVVPFQELDGESWPEHQNYYLELLASLGAAALTGGHVLKPAPALTPGRGNSSGNIYQDMYNLELRKIWDAFAQRTDIRFRCKAYAGSKAEWSISEPTGPYVDYMVGRMNPEDFLLFEDYTILRNSITDYITYAYGSLGPLNWTDFHGIVANRLNGYSYNA